MRAQRHRRSGYATGTKAVGRLCYPRCKLLAMRGLNFIKRSSMCTVDIALQIVSAEVAPQQLTP